VTVALVTGERSTNVDDGRPLAVGHHSFS